MKARKREIRVRFLFWHSFIVLMHLLLCELHTKNYRISIENQQPKKKTLPAKKVHTGFTNIFQNGIDDKRNTLKCEVNTIAMHNSHHGSAARPSKRNTCTRDARATYRQEITCVKLLFDNYVNPIEFIFLVVCFFSFLAVLKSCGNCFE